jgi:hypothetical protein
MIDYIWFWISKTIAELIMAAITLGVIFVGFLIWAMMEVIKERRAALKEGE